MPLETFDDSFGLSEAAQKFFNLRFGNTEQAELRHHLLDHLREIQIWVPRLLEPFPFKTSKLEMAIYECLMDAHLLRGAEDLGRLEEITIVSPAHAAKLISEYLSGAGLMATLQWRLSATAMSPSVSSGQAKRAKSSSKIEQILLADLLQAILPETHFKAVEALGIDAANWHRDHNAGIAYGIKKHRESIAAMQATFAESYRTGKKEKRSSDRQFIEKLAQIWEIGTQSPPTVTFNRDHGTESTFLSFVGAAWRVATGEAPPSATKIRKIIKGK